MSFLNWGAQNWTPLQMQSNKCWAEGIIASLDPLAVLLLTQPGVPEILSPAGAHCWLTFTVLSSKMPRPNSDSCFPMNPQPVSLQGVIPPQEQDFTFFLLELAHFYSLPRSLWLADLGYQLVPRTWCHPKKLDGSALCHLLQVINRDINQDRSLGTLVLHFLPTSINHYPLRPII